VNLSTDDPGLRKLVDSWTVTHGRPMAADLFHEIFFTKIILEILIFCRKSPNILVIYFPNIFRTKIIPKIKFKKPFTIKLPPLYLIIFDRVFSTKTVQLNYRILGHCIFYILVPLFQFN
jgi:hypothetical protein